MYRHTRMHACASRMQAVGDGTGVKPIYEVLMEIKGLPFLQSRVSRLGWKHGKHRRSIECWQGTYCTHASSRGRVSTRHIFPCARLPCVAGDDTDVAAPVVRWRRCLLQCSAHYCLLALCMSRGEWWDYGTTPAPTTTTTFTSMGGGLHVAHACQQKCTCEHNAT